jgi:hypothetical protein
MNEDVAAEWTVDDGTTHKVKINMVVYETHMSLSNGGGNDDTTRRNLNLVAQYSNPLTNFPRDAAPSNDDDENDEEEDEEEEAGGRRKKGRALDFLPSCESQRQRPWHYGGNRLDSTFYFIRFHSTQK